MLIAIVTRFYGLGDRVVSHDESLHTQYSYQYYNGDGYVHSPLMHGPTFMANPLSTAAAIAFMQKEAQQGKPPRAYRELFRELRELEAPQEAPPPAD